MFNNKDRKKQIFSERGVFRCFKGRERKKFRDKPPSSVPATLLWADAWCRVTKNMGATIMLSNYAKRE